MLIIIHYYEIQQVARLLYALFIIVDTLQFTQRLFPLKLND
jgi:hypothetical protein